MIDCLTLILCSHASQILTLRLRDTKAIKCILNLGRNIVPRLALLLYWLDIVIDIVKVNVRQISAPGWHRTFLEEIQALEAEVAHPTGFALHLGDLLNDLSCQPFFGLECIIFGYMEPS